MTKGVKLNVFLIAIIIVTLLVAGCGGSSNNKDQEPEHVRTEPEELETIELEIDEKMKATVSVSSGSTLAIRRSPGVEGKPEGDIVARVPRGRLLWVVDMHNDSRVKDGYTWWEVEDQGTGLSGWAAAEFLDLE